MKYVISTYLRKTLALCLGLVLLVGLLVTAAPILARADESTPTPSELETNDTLAKTYVPETALVTPATVVTDVTGKDILDNLTDASGRSPANAILHVDAQMNVVDAKGAAIGSFYDVYKSFDNKIIPVVYVNDGKAADAFISFMRTKLHILDVAVISKDVSLVKKVRSELTEIRGIVEYDGVNSLYEVVRSSTDAGAMTVVIPQDTADTQYVTYLQARFKTVWVRANSSSYGDVADSLFGGAFGVIADYSAVYDVMKDLSGLTRNIFNVAHRGLRKVYNENGLIGLEASMNAGVTHVELDAMLTKDKHVVIMHDDSISRTTTGTGNVADKTLEELRQYVLKDKDPSAKEKIPTLEEVVDLMKSMNEQNGTDVVLILEIKADDLDLVPRIKEILDEKEFYENIVFVTFESSEHQLAALRDNMPWVPASGLNDVNANNFASQLGTLNALRAGVDPSKGNFTPQFIHVLTDRGFTPWSWTFDEVGSTTNTTFDGVNMGLLGVTSDEADIYSDMLRYAYGNDRENVEDEDAPNVGDTALITLIYYNGDMELIEATINRVEEQDWGWQCFVTYTLEINGVEQTLHLRAINYYKPIRNNLWLIISLVAGALLVGAAIAVTAVSFKKKKNNGETI